MKLISIFKALSVFAFCIIFMGASDQKGIFDGSGDIGNPKLKGSFNYDAATKTYTLSGGGFNIWNDTDQFYYAWKKVSGNFSMTTKVAFEGKGVDPHRKIGIMIRETLTGPSRYADIGIHGDGLTSLQYRPVTGEATLEIVGPRNGNYITLERKGNKISMRTATDKAPSDVTAEVELTFPSSVYVGIYIGSHNLDVVETAYFTNVEFTKLK